jgi:tRNA modification GTPase
LDFVEEDIEFISRSEVLDRLNAADEQLAAVAQQLNTRRTPAEMNQVVLVGEPNVGKSSLFNAIVQQCGHLRSTGTNLSVAALVSPQRGTTRDYLTATISLDGLDCVLVDTAGVEPMAAGAAAIESSAQELSADRRRRASVRVGCIDAVSWMDISTNIASRLNDESWDVVALTKSDLVDDSISNKKSCVNNNPNVEVVATSSRSGAGIVELCQAIRKRLSRDAAPEPAGAIAATAERCGESVRLAGNAIRAASKIAESGAGEELIASELRVALAELGKVVGSVYTDDLLDRIFRTFCIGK